MWNTESEPSEGTEIGPGFYAVAWKDTNKESPTIVEVFSTGRRLKVSVLGRDDARDLDEFEFFNRLTFHKVPSSSLRVAYEDRPVSIWHESDAAAFHAATKEEQEAWNAYANAEASKFQEGLDAYETVHGCIGYDRDGKITNWCPPVYFPEWLEQHRASKA